jgi:hypothetical protein
VKFHLSSFSAHNIEIIAVPEKKIIALAGIFDDRPLTLERRLGRNCWNPSFQNPPPGLGMIFYHHINGLRAAQALIQALA